MRITIIGGGAAGCFCAVNIKRNLPDAEVTLLEAGKRLLAKVAITGGGRCNITNSFRAVKGVDSVYPRGGKLMKRLLKVFSHEDAYRWFEDAGIALMTQEDECVFPVSQDAMQVVRTLEGLLMRHGVKVIKNHKVTDITEVQKEADAVVVTVGGKPKQSGLDFLSPLGIECVTPVPSLFTFNVGDKALHELMGTVVENVTARLSGTKMTANGPLLITHWGLSGSAILKLSSYGARYLAERDYKAEVAVNWFGSLNEDEVLEELNELASNHAKRQLTSAYPTIFIQRHWQYLLTKAGLSSQKRWNEVGPKQLRRLASMLINDTYQVEGKGAFKDEFVTCGGVALSAVHPNTLESREHPGLYFAGEVLDIDALTGGFNLQAAWTTAYVVAQAIAASAM